jgi:hypothetical protein
MNYNFGLLGKKKRQSYEMDVDQILNDANDDRPAADDEDDIENTPYVVQPRAFVYLFPSW